MHTHFELPDLRLLQDTEEIEVEVETSAAGPLARCRSTIWIVVVGEEVFVRSVNGEQGHWYQALTQRAVGKLCTEDRHIPIRAERISETELQQQVSEAYLRKYAQYPDDVAWMVGPTAAPTTLRLRPRF